jgi:hypothetical protein
VLRVRRTLDTMALWLIALLAACASVGHWLMSLAKMLAVRCSSRHSQTAALHQLKVLRASAWWALRHQSAPIRSVPTYG